MPRKTKRRAASRLSWIAYHEAGHAVIYFAVENPHSPHLSIVPDDECDGRLRHGSGGDHIPGHPPCIGHTWRLLAGIAADDIYARTRARLRTDHDHGAALLSTFADKYQGQIKSIASADLTSIYARAPRKDREALRNERKHVDVLLKLNWHVVKRVAEALLAERELDETRLRALIEDPGDLIKVWDSSVWSAYCASGKKYMSLWKERMGVHHAA